MSTAIDNQQLANSSSLRRHTPDPQENSSVHAGVGLTSMRERAPELGESLVG